MQALLRFASTSTPVVQPPDVVISQNAKLAPIGDIAKKIGLKKDEILPYGSSCAKIQLSVLDRLKSQPDGKYIDVTAISPTPLGEGKTTTTIGLSQALGAHLHKKVMTVIRQPSQGPTFGIKGGAAGGGYSQVVPMETINIHLTGDFHALTAAANLCAAAIDARILHEKSATDKQLFDRLVPKGKPFTVPMRRRLRALGLEARTKNEEFTEEEKKRYARLDIDPNQVLWHRVIDTSDRFLRDIEIGREANCLRRTGFDITTASECMAVLALATSLPDLRSRLGRMAVAVSRDGRLITADDLGVAGAMTVLMKDALMPNLMQTLEHTPAIVHAGPFANIAHGNSSVIGDMVGLKLVGRDGFVVTESGFGADCGMEKFMNIKCRQSGLRPNAVVLVTTIRGLKHQGGGPAVVAGQRLPAPYVTENLDLLKKGMCNMERHIRNACAFGVPTVVAINYFPTDTPAEIELVRQAALKAGARDAVVAKHFAKGGAGAADLAEAVVKASKEPSHFEFTYPLDMSIKEKIHTVATKIYGAKSVKYSDAAEKKVALFTRLGFDKLPVCLAKTQYSFSHDPQLKGAPSGFVLPVRDINASAGAGFLVPLLGSMQTMPGLPTRAAFWNIDIDDKTGRVVGLN